jgi:exopolysaccharide biosynthesis polyprenyl glycosylphosphotransferase
MSILYYNRLPRFIFLFDFIFLNIALVSAHFMVFNSNDLNVASSIFFLISNVCWAFMSLLNKNHRITQPLNLNDIVDKFLMTLIYQLLAVLAAIYFFKVLNVSRGFVIISFAIFFLAIVVQRLLLFFFLQNSTAKWYATKKITVLGNKKIADSLLSTFSNHPEYGYKLEQFISDEEIKDMTEEALLSDLLSGKPEEIFICYKDMDTESLDRLILFGDKSSIKIKVVFDLISNIKEGNLVKYDNIPILHINSQPELSVKVRFLKRSFDILFASTLMIIGIPVFFLLYLITKFTSRGPAFFRQERIGKHERPFYIYKFRSMHVNAEKFGPQLSKDNDPRVTKWGRIMRKTRLDELPQFWNVIKGEMSIVGYRPERKHFIEEISKITPDYKKLLRHKPGITSLGQIHYGYAENVDQMCERLRYDLLYSRNVNLNSDVSIILKTVRVMVQGKGK